MESEERKIMLVATTLIILLFVVFIVLLFGFYQKRKNLLLEQKAEDKKRFEREIAETQIEIREETLRNISWELHDNIGQLLTLAKIQLQSATLESFNEVSETITKGLTEVRALSKLINPEAIKNIKLKEAVQLEIDRFNRMNFIKSTLKISGEEQNIDEKSNIIIFRILQEFFANTIKHSKASNLDVLINFRVDELEITAKDNGVGFSSNSKSDGIGLENIKNRAKLIGASAVFTSEVNKGTSLKIVYKL